MRDGHAEPANAQLRHGLQKIRQSLHQKRQIDGVHIARDETRVVQERTERVSDGIADYAVHASAARELVRPVEVLELVKRNLARRGGRVDGGVRQRTALPQRQDARGQADFPHRHGNNLAAIPRQT